MSPAVPAQTRMRRLWQAATSNGHRRAVLVLTLAASVAVIPGAASADSPAEQAAREIQEARDRANDAAQAMFDAEARLDELEVEIANTEAEIVRLDTELGGLRDSLSEMALRRYTSGGISSNPLFTPISGINDAATANVFSGAATGSVLTNTDEFEATLEELDDARAELADQQTEAEQASQQYEALRAIAEAEVVRLQEVEQQRLADEAVQRELERQRQERQAAEAAEAQAAAAEAAAQQAANQQSSSQTQQQPDQAQAPSDQTPNQQADQSGQSDQQPEQPSAPPPAPAPTPAPAPQPSAGSGMVCPVAGSAAYADTWGASRSGGRSHQGVDMLAARGTPLVAVESGSVQFKQTNLGGNSVWLNGSSGTRYFYAHLDGFEGSSRGVSRGEVIGYVGDTGNARGTPHLHFEVHPNGPAVNPYPYVRAVC